MKNKSDLLERIEEMTTEEDFKNFIFISDKGISTCADYKETAVLLTTLIKTIVENGFQIEDVNKAVRLSQLTEDEMLEELKNKLKEMLGE